MNWRAKVWFFLSGYVGCFAVFAALVGRPVSMGVGAAVTALYWVFGNMSADKKGD